MKKIKQIVVVVLAVILFLPMASVSANDTVPSENITTVTPFKTSYRPGGYTKIELYSNGREVWWSVKPNTTKTYSYYGLVTVTFTNNSSYTYPVSGSAGGGRALSGSFSLNGKAKYVGIVGYAINSDGIYISLPTSD